MPKTQSRKKKKKVSRRHDPLERQISSSVETGSFKADRGKVDEEKGQAEQDYVPEAMSKKIFNTAREQQNQINQEQGKKAVATLGSTVADDDSDVEQEELLAAGFEDDMEDIEIPEADEAELNMFMPESQGTRRTLADIIMEKIAQKQAGMSQVGDSAEDKDAAIQSSLDPKLLDVYGQVATYMGRYTSGKVPKAFKIIPSLKNWEEVLFVTLPDKWTAQSYFVATRLFASALNEKLAQRFFNTVLLPRIRQNIEVHQRLNYHLYASLKKSLYKPAAFFRGILLPLALEGCTAREALIMSSVLAKNSIPALHSSVALLKLAQMPYSGPCTLFMKTLLNKKYSLPYRVIDALTSHFAGFQNDPRKMPVVWHQTVLVFVQRYKIELTDKQRNTLRAMLRKQVHPGITQEIRRELFAQAPSLTMRPTVAGGMDTSS